MGVDPAAEVVAAGFGDIPDDAKPAAGVAVEGGVAEGEFTFVAGGDDDVAEFVGDGHKDDPTQARLEVFFGDVFGTIFKGGF